MAAARRGEAGREVPEKRPPASELERLGLVGGVKMKPGDAVPLVSTAEVVPGGPGRWLWFIHPARPRRRCRSMRGAHREEHHGAEDGNGGNPTV